MAGEQRIAELEAQLAAQAENATTAAAQAAHLQAQLDVYRAVPTAQAMATAFAQALADNPPARGGGGDRQHRKVGGPMPTYSGKSTESYSQFESMFKGWASYNNL